MSSSSMSLPPLPSSDSLPPPCPPPPPAAGDNGEACGDSSPALVPLFGAVGAARLNEIQQGRARLKKNVTNDSCAPIVTSANPGPGSGGGSSSSGMQPIEGLMGVEGLSANDTSAGRSGEAGGARGGIIMSHTSAPADQRPQNRGGTPTENNEQSSMESTPAASSRAATVAAEVAAIGGGAGGGVTGGRVSGQVSVSCQQLAERPPPYLFDPKGVASGSMRPLVGQPSSASVNSTATARPPPKPPRVQSLPPEPENPDQGPSPAAATSPLLPQRPGAGNAGRPLPPLPDDNADDWPTIPAPPPPMFGRPLPTPPPTTAGGSQAPEGASPLSLVGAGGDRATTPVSSHPMNGRPLPLPPHPISAKPPPMFGQRPPPNSNDPPPPLPERRAGPEVVRTEMGSVAVEAVLGNIVNETTDAIVNGTNNAMDLTGQVSRTLLEKGGRRIAADCKAKGEIGDTGVFCASTQGTSLQFKYILHVDVQKPVEFLIKSCLKEADRLQLRSVSLPALGTGKLQAQAENVISRLVSGVREFLTTATLSHLRLVRFVAFDSSTIEIFKREITAPPGPYDFLKGKQLDYREDIIGPDSTDFNKVRDAFFETASRKLICVQIKRIQNPTLLQQYRSQRVKVAANMPRSSSLPIERWLWHGTDEASHQKICLHGFNRSYCGVHGTRYGQGVYFARDASYSTNYSKPNKAGDKQIIYSRVLTGEFIRGNEDMRVPPPRTHGNQANYDTSVDSVENPSIFVVYHDSQAYPEFVITFRQ